MSDAPPTGSLLRFATTLVTRQRRAAAVLLLLNLGIIAMTLVTPLLTGWAVERIDADDLSGIDGAFVAARDRSAARPVARWGRSQHRCRRRLPGRQRCAPTHASPSSASISRARPNGCWTPRWPSTGWALAR